MDVSVLEIQVEFDLEFVIGIGFHRWREKKQVIISTNDEEIKGITPYQYAFNHALEEIADYCEKEPKIGDLHNLDGIVIGIEKLNAAW